MLQNNLPNTFTQASCGGYMLPNNIHMTSDYKQLMRREDCAAACMRARELRGTQHEPKGP